MAWPDLDAAKAQIGKNLAAGSDGQVQVGLDAVIAHLHQVCELPIPSTTLTAAVTLPSATLAVDWTRKGFPATGTLNIDGQLVAYTGLSDSTFTGCTGGTGTFAAGTTVKSAGRVVTADLYMGALLLVARIYRRKDSPHGAVGFVDVGAIRIAMKDPDVKAFIGPYLSIGIG